MKDQLAEDLTEGLERDQFELLYQPVITLSSGQVTAAEALLRWHHPSHGVLLPPSFLSLSEDNGSIVPLGRWVLEQACAQLRAWLDRFPGRSLSVGVNLSASQLEDPGFADQVEASIERFGLPSGALTLEISESRWLSDRQRVGLDELAGRGVVLALDNFGRGYSSLGQVQRYKVNVLKIAPDLFALDKPGQHTGQVIQAIVQMSHSLDIRTVANGVEASEQLDVVTAFGCDAAQGYHLAEPMADEAVAALLARDGGAGLI